MSASTAWSAGSRTRATSRRGSRSIARTSPASRLLGVAEKLDYLSGLGIDTIYLNPVFASASNHRYHTYDYFRVDALLGGDAALRELIDSAHDRGIRVLLDGVFNHTGRGFWPFHHLLECGESSPYRDWFVVRDWPLRAYAKKPNYEAWWSLPALPKLNVANLEVREYLLRVATHWTEFGADGWRLDVPQEIDDRSFWGDFRARVLAANPEAYLVGELWDVEPSWVGGGPFDGLMNYPLARAVLGFCARRLEPKLSPGGRRVRRLSARAMVGVLDELLRGEYSAETTRVQWNLLGSHDTPRFVTMAGCDHGALWLATLIQMTLPGVPCVYYGDEVGLEGGPDPDCRRAFPWDESEWHRPTYDVFRRAIALRRAEPALRRGEFASLYGHDDVIAYSRTIDDHAIVVVLNVRDESVQRSIPLPEGFTPRGATRELWAPDAEPARLELGRKGRRSMRVDVPGRSGRVVRVDR